MKLHSCRMLKIFWNHAKATQVLCFFQIPKRRAKKKKKRRRKRRQKQKQYQQQQ